MAGKQVAETLLPIDDPLILQTSNGPASGDQTFIPRNVRSIDQKG